MNSVRMTIDKQKNIWNNIWKNSTKIDPKRILDTRFTQAAYNCLKKFIDYNKDKLILEAGYGTGRLCCLLARDYPDSQVVGIDISPNSLVTADCLKKYLQVQNVTFGIGNIFKMQYPDNHFDLVFNEGVIEHFSIEEHPNYKDAVAEMIRVTKPQGKIIVAVPNWYCLPHTIYKWILKKLNKRYIYEYEKSFKHSELITLFSEFGLRKIELSAFLPAHGFYRLDGKGFRQIFDHLGRFIDFVQSFDSLINNSFTKRFGFEIVIKGNKS